MTAGQFRFDDGKDPAALRTIGELADALGLRQHVLRYWEAQFPMLRPLKRSGSRRYYRPEDVALVATIDRLVNREGYTLKGARAALERGVAPAEQAPPAPRPAPAEQAAPAAERPVHADLALAAQVLPQLRALRQRLADALAE